MRTASAVFLLVLFAAGSQAWAQEQDYEFRPPPTGVDSSAAALMRDLAARVLPVYQESEPDRYLVNVSALQMVAGDYAAADTSRQQLRDRRRAADATRPVDRSVINDIYASAKALEADDRVSFAEAFARSYREVIPRMSDQDAFAVAAWLETSPAVFRQALQNALDRQRGKSRIGQSDALELIRAYLAFDAYRSFSSLVGTLDAEDDRRRYLPDEEVQIKTPDGASIAAVVVRPANPSTRLPALLEITIADSRNHAKECAAHGYVGVFAYTRGTHQSSGIMVPYLHDGDDARTVINWIALQPWSDGRVGMYGEGYGAFTAWAAAKRPPPALKAIAPSAPNAPGIDAPMAGNIMQNSGYRWSLRLTRPQVAIDSDYLDDGVWRALDQKWYASGRRYRDMGRLYGKSNPIFIRWLNHPSYDLFWQKMLPDAGQWAHIDIPVLTMTGYYAASMPGALYYFTQHHRYNSKADHTLVIGPYDDGAMQRAPPAVLHGLHADSAALVDLRELRFQWFDHVFKGAATPALLRDRINYQVMGENAWRYAASLEAMSTGSLRFYLEGAAPPARNRLTQRKPAHPTFLLQTLKFTDRSDLAWTPSTDIVSKTLATHNDVVFVSDPLRKPTEFSGLFSGRLDFTANKMDLDLNVALYERLATGEYLRLFSPTYEFRASYARDRAHRHLLKAGERQELTFKSERVTSRQLQAGSRLVMTLGVNKRPDREINYGAGSDVSEESIEDGAIALKIRWYSDSYIDLPVHR